MSKNERRVPEFWEYLSGIMTPEASLWDWRTVLGKDVNFEAFRRKYLLPTDRLTMRIFCPLKCNSGCRFCDISEPYGDDDAREGFCPETMKSFPVGNKDIIINEFQGDVLLAEAARTLGTEPKLLDISGFDYTWELGRVPGFSKVPVYGTLLCMGDNMLELFAALNRKTKGPYILLVTHDDLINDSNKLLLDDSGASYVPLNKAVRFNADAELEIIGDFDLRKLIVSPQVEVEPEPDNIFRKCGDVWEIRFNGGDKFMLTGVDTGAKYVHYLLERPGIKTPVTEIVRKLSFADGRHELNQIEDSDGELTGITLTDIPSSDSGFVADSMAIEQYRNEARQLIGELAQAREMGDGTNIMNIQADLDILQKIISEAVSPQGQGKKLNDPWRSIENSFRNAINRIVRKIARYDEKLAVHLETSIQCGVSPVYLPAREMEWRL